MLYLTIIDHLVFRLLIKGMQLVHLQQELAQIIIC